MKHDEYYAHDHLTQASSTSTPATVTVPSTESSTAATTQTVVTITRTRKPPAPPLAAQFWGTGQHPRTADREETLRVLMHKTKFSGHSNVDTDIADFDDHYLESLFAGRTKSGIIYLGPDEMASKHIIRVNLKIGTKNTRIGVSRELEGGMKNHALSRQHDLALDPFSGIVLRHVIIDNCRMELIGASACCNLQGRPLTVSLTWLLAEPP